VLEAIKSSYDITCLETLESLYDVNFPSKFPVPPTSNFFEGDVFDIPILPEFSIIILLPRLVPFGVNLER
jgi:hypothetical protein